MDTDALIEALARDAAPVARRALAHRLAAGLLAGGGVASLLALAGLGIRHDLADVAGTSGFLTKMAFTLALGVAGLLLVVQLARPETQRLHRTWLVGAPVALLALAAAIELVGSASSARTALLTEPTWTCIPLILGLAVPLFAGLVWALRQMAPTRLRAAGAAAGLSAAGFGATLYCLYCQQLSPTYVFTRYGLAIALVSAAGALLGPRLLRW